MGNDALSLLYIMEHVCLSGQAGFHLPPSLCSVVLVICPDCLPALGLALQRGGVILLWEGRAASATPTGSGSGETL